MMLYHKSFKMSNIVTILLNLCIVITVMLKCSLAIFQHSCKS